MTVADDDSTLRLGPEGTSAVSAVGAQAPPRAQIGGTLGRYVIVAEAGAGGMGRVYRAYDPKLKREVALKLIRIPAGEGREQALDESRIVREAQAMARLSHPSVLPVYDVERVGESMFLVMEFVSGQTLKEWLGADRSASDILRAFVEAGRGLQAAHGAGIVHRDFKPSNVLVGDDGRVRVMDFGAARGTTSTRTSTAAMSLVDGCVDGSDETDIREPLTKAGTVMGTPAYMAPEQQRGEAASPASDQYAFCVSLFEGLCGARPFTQRRYHEVLRAKESGRLPPIPSGAKLPRWVHHVIRRGLAPAPSDRYPSMAAMLAALEADPAGRRRRWSARLLVGGAIASGAGALSYQMTRASEQCAGGRSRIEEVWGDEQRSKIAEAMLGTGLVYAKDTWSRVERELDAYAEQWLEARREMCEATNVRGERSAEALDLEMACLERRRLALGSLVDALARELAPEQLARSVEAVSSLPRLEPCRDLEVLRARVPLPEHPDDRRRAEEGGTRLLKAEGMVRAGRYEEALQEARAVEHLATSLNYDPLRAAAMLVIGEARQQLGEYPESKVALIDAYDDAIAVGDDELATRAIARIATLMGFDLGEPDEAKQWIETAWSWVDRNGRGGLLEAQISQAAGTVARENGQMEQALEHTQRTLDLFETIHGEDEHPDVAQAVTNVATMLYHVQRLDEAEAYQARALAMYMRLYGPEHPRVADALSTHAAICNSRGDFEQGYEDFLRALVIRERALGADHPDVAGAHNNLASTLLEMGRIAEARDHATRAVTGFEATLGAEHPVMAYAQTNMGRTLELQGEYEAARHHYERALELRERTLGEGHPGVARALVNLADLDRARGRFDAAKPRYERALEIYTKAYGPDFSWRALALVGLVAIAMEGEQYDQAYELATEARRVFEATDQTRTTQYASILRVLASVAGKRGRTDEARELLDVALEVAEAVDLALDGDAAVRFSWARAAWSEVDGRDRARALEEARRAAKAYEELDEQEALAEVRAWLERRQ